MHDNIRDVMSSRPKTLDADQTVAAAAQLMREADIGDVLVVKSDDRLHGILTDRDIVVRVLAEGLDPNQTRVGDICSRVLTTVSPDDGVSHAVRVMREKAIRRLPVEAGGRVIGMLTIGDIAVERDIGSVLADISAAPRILDGAPLWLRRPRSTRSVGRQEGDSNGKEARRRGTSSRGGTGMEADIRHHPRRPQPRGGGQIGADAKGRIALQAALKQV